MVALDRVVTYAFSFGELWKSLERSLKDVHQFIDRFEAVYGTDGGRGGAAPPFRDMTPP